MRTWMKRALVRALLGGGGDTRLPRPDVRAPGAELVGLGWDADGLRRGVRGVRAGRKGSDKFMSVTNKFPCVAP